jgi:uncharacterized membrane protein
MPGVCFEPKIPVVELAKTFHALDYAATVIGCPCIWMNKLRKRNFKKSEIG